MKNEILIVLEKAKNEGIRPADSRLRSVQELARVKVSIPNDDWDCQQDLLPCLNGVLHSPTRTLKPHSPDYHFTTGLDFDYDPEAECPKFKYVLETTMPESECFLQEYAGYCLTTDTHHEMAVWLYGPPGSGKSTIIAGFQAMLGSSAGLLGLADIARSSFALTNVPGKKLVVSTEQPAGQKIATHVLNPLISGEPMTVEQKYRHPYVFTPHTKVMWAMNDLPEVDSANDGLLRRIKVIKFPSLADKDRDLKLKDAVKEEGPGILNWALDGLLRLRDREYFDPPPAVLNATKDFVNNADIPAQFVAERCVTGIDVSTQSSILHKAYQQWCFDNGHNAKSITAIAKDWKQLGFKKSGSNGRNMWRGVGLQDSRFS